MFPASLKASRIPETVEIGDVVTFQHGGYFQNGRPRTPWILHIRPEISAESYLIGHHGYYLAKKKTAGECHACRKALPPNNIRLCTDKAKASTGQLGMFYMMHVEFCPSLDCVRMRSPSLVLPQFKNKVIVLEDAREVEQQEERTSTHKNQQFGLEPVDVESKEIKQLASSQPNIEFISQKKFLESKQ